MPLRLHLKDRLFPHSEMAGREALGERQDHVEWIREDGPADVRVFTDRSIEEAEGDPARLKVAWLCESPLVTAKRFRRLAKDTRPFDVVLTCIRSMTDRGPPYVFCPPACTWIPERHWGVEAKEADLSIIASAKRDLPGHKLRWKILKKLGDRIDAVLGRGHRPIEHKTEGLKPFRYSIVLENARDHDYFSEKLIDPLLCGTIPIYWGCPPVERYFDPRGIHSFRTLRELRMILDQIGPDDYASRMDAVRANFEAAQHYQFLEQRVAIALGPLLDAE